MCKQENNVMENNMQAIEISLGLILYKCKFFVV